MPEFGWDVPNYVITGVLLFLFLVALLIAPLSKYWENIFFKIAVAGFWAYFTLWVVKVLRIYFS